MSKLRVLIWGSVGFFLLLGSGCTTATLSQDQAPRTDVVYSCACGSECTCNTVSTKPGKCACGKDLEWGHVVKVEGDEVLLCTCAEGCKCAIDSKDNTRCGCGMPLKRVSLKGSELSFCNCGGSCFCNTVSDQPGKCKCGMPLKKAI